MSYSRPAMVAETHIATVFFSGDRAYKLKKPVRNGFLDFTTREARERACRREVELNRRFSPDVYLGVYDVRDERGVVCDHLVAMRRMDPERRLSALVRMGEPVGDPLREVARRLAAWHAGAPRGPEISREGGRDALRRRWTDNLAETAAYGLPEAAEIERLVLRFLDGRGPLFARRVADDRIVDGHGDLIADDVFCLPDGPRILDCLEFDDRLRYVDGLDDAAFLAMDLERLRAPALARAFLDRYSEFGGDPAPASLRHHYIAYRAFVRAKVSCLSERPAVAREYAELALRHLRAGSVALVLVGGLPGTGKSTLAGALGDRLGWSVLSSDRTRKELAGLAAEQPARAPYGQGIYGPRATKETYAELLRRAEKLLGMGEPVVLDASWSDEVFREEAATVARRARADLVALECRTPALVSSARLRDRRGGPSDADTAVAEAMAAEAAPWPGAVAVDTDQPVEVCVDEALRAVRPHGYGHHWPLRPQMAPD
ncbi:bifunctional aminoglycoside phosphotransferase/ATP-binding protein [Actinocorallia populi]|uniref:bifunctional aminoglycoside phosphotransferase/ATP-binding protein n=1 Tax=Actinocorallia populi TaxID=2079200 RepID=UPI000D089397|nr:AAA family ATPase [Actinocorallia populi]